MTEGVDAGAIVDLAPMSGELGAVVGEYFFHRLPGHAAHRIAALIERWRRDEPIERLAMAPRPLRHCSKARLATDRQLNWRWPAARVERWVRALAALAPAWWVDMHGRRTEVMQARTLSGVPASSCGTVLHREGRWIEIACEDGAIALRCRHAFRAAAGDRLPLVTHAPSGAA
jgi:methionyl-tRNA formyltransferase